MPALTLGLDLPPLGDDLMVVRATIREAISTPTRATVLVQAVDDVAEADLLDRPATLSLSVGEEAARELPLVVTEATYEGTTRDELGDRHVYRLTLEHAMVRLRLRTNCRIFQDQDVATIVKEVLEGGGVPSDHVAIELADATEPRAYCVQYRESDFDFVSRLLEFEGAHYLIADVGEGPSLVVSDAASGFPPIDGDTDEVILGEGFGGGVRDLEVETIATPARVSLNDYNHEQPPLSLIAEAIVDVPSSFGTEVYTYGEGYQLPAAGLRLAKLRAEALAATHETLTGTINEPTLRPGRTFQLSGVAREDFARGWLVTEVLHECEARGGQSYRARFRAIPDDVPYRPPVSTPRPKMRGYHVAVATGPSGEEIHTDAEGRMKAHYFWDREGPTDDGSSRWMRLCQLPIGGSMALARVGWEMSVAYRGGDPDRPVAVHRLYNAEKASPYAQPGASARSAFQTASSPGAGNSNELRMDDTSGSQELFAHASYDFNSVTKNDKTETVGVDETTDIGTSSVLAVGVDETIDIGANRTLTIGAGEKIQIGADRSKSVGGSETVTVLESITTKIAGSDAETVGGSHTSLAAGGIERTSVGSQTVTVGGSMINLAASGVSVAVLGAKNESVGGAKIALAAGGCGDSTVGAMAINVGGVVLQAAGGNRMGSATGSSAVNVGGVAMANGGSKLQMSAKKITVRVAGVANLTGGGGIVTLTPGTATFVGIIGSEGSGGVKIKGNPNLVG